MSNLHPRTDGAALVERTATDFQHCTLDGIQYRRNGSEPLSPWGGQWEWLYKGIWRELRNGELRVKVNRLLSEKQASVSDTNSQQDLFQKVPA